MKNLNNVFNETLEKKAAERLVRAQKCSMTKNDEYRIPVYGYDLNIVDGNRRWLFDKLIASGVEFEMARIESNKTILYVRESDLQKEMQKIA